MLNRERINGSERGNALFLILIAVALFAALSYAVTSSNRGGGSTDRETSMIGAGQITQYPNGIRTAITRMILAGTTVPMLDFTITAGAAGIFAPDGGGALYEKAPSGIAGSATGAAGEGGPGTTVGTLAPNTWGFKDARDAALGYYILGVGTDTNITGRDVIAYLNDLSLAVCQQIDRGLGIANFATPAVNAAAVVYTTGVGKGAAGPAGAGGNGNTFGALTGQAFACIQQGAAGKYDYYHALAEQ